MLLNQHPFSKPEMGADSAASHDYTAPGARAPTRLDRGASWFQFYMPLSRPRPAIFYKAMVCVSEGRATQTARLNLHQAATRNGGRPSHQPTAATTAATAVVASAAAGAQEAGASSGGEASHSSPPPPPPPGRRRPHHLPRPGRRGARRRTPAAAVDRAPARERPQGYSEAAGQAGH